MDFFFFIIRNQISFQLCLTGEQFLCGFRSTNLILSQSPFFHRSFTWRLTLCLKFNICNCKNVPLGSKVWHSLLESNDSEKELLHINSQEDTTGERQLKIWIERWQVEKQFYTNIGDTNAGIFHTCIHSDFIFNEILGNWKENLNLLEMAFNERLNLSQNCPVHGVYR